MEEKVLYVKLPEGAEYRKVIVTEDGRIGIAYSEECACLQKNEATMSKVEIPKPKPLVGGSEVYQNDDVPYWYCKIKNCRDTFMHIYMEDLTEQDLLYDSKTGKKRPFSNSKQNKFKADVMEALANKPKEGFRWIPMYEPSFAPNGGVQFVKGEKILVGLNCPEWEKILKEYSPENESGKSSKTTYFLLLLRWLKDDIATLEQLADHSEEIGHYWDSKNPKHHFEKTGERKFGGLYGFAGNTYKIIEDLNSESCFSIAGCDFYCNGKVFPLAHIYSIKYPYSKYGSSIGLLELKK